MVIASTRSATLAVNRWHLRFIDGQMLVTVSRYVNRDSYMCFDVVTNPALHYLFNSGCGL